MEMIQFTLGNSEDSRLVKIFRIIFGIACIGIAIFWLNFNFEALKSDWTLWLTILFLTGFGLYQIWSGLGRATRYISISSEKIILKKNAILSPKRLLPGEIEKIDIFPLSIVFYDKNRKKSILRLGTINVETNEKIVDELIGFAEKNSIPYEIKEEEIFKDQG
jgi:hypothetical protein